MSYLAKLSLTNLKTNEETKNRHPLSEIFANFRRAQGSGHRELRSPLRQLENEHGSNRGSNGQERLREARDEVDLVRHVHSPLIEMDLTVSRLHRPPMHNKRRT
jgi:hypothetical protein